MTTKAKTPAKRSTKAKAEEEPKQEEAQAEVKPANGVFVSKITAEDGSVSTDVVPTGDVQVTEVQTLIELGLASWRAKVGLNS